MSYFRTKMIYNLMVIILYKHLGVPQKKGNIIDEWFRLGYLQNEVGPQGGGYNENGCPCEFTSSVTGKLYRKTTSFLGVAFDITLSYEENIEWEFYFRGWSPSLCKYFDNFNISVYLISVQSLKVGTGLVKLSGFHFPMGIRWFCSMDTL